MDRMASFGNLSLGSRLKRLSDRLVQDVADIYQRQGIELNPRYFPLFNLLYLQGPMAVTQAAELLSVSHPAVSKTAAKMLEEGWLTKQPDPADERRQLLAISEQGQQLLVEIEPIWRAIKGHLDAAMARQQYPLLAALDEFERDYQSNNMVEPVLAQLANPVETEQLEIVGWQAQYRELFKALNMDWLDNYFDGELIEDDLQALNSPESYYLSRGGYIWFARYQGEIVGCIALAKRGADCYEISKMAVPSEVQGLGIGRKLMIQALEKAHQLNAQHIYLETASLLTRACTLYRNMGFVEVPHPEGRSRYPRSDVYMQLTIGAS